MPVFLYKARGSRGDLLQGQVEAQSQEAVASQLLNGGITPVEILAAPPESAGIDLQRLFRSGSVALPELILFCRQMYALNKAGVPLVRGLRSLTESTAHPLLHEVLERIVEDVQAGRELSTAMAAHPRVFSNLMVAMARVGENTGRLEEAFLRMGQYLELERDTRERIGAALRYPLLVVIAIGIAIGVVNILVIPAFAGVFARAKAELPLPTRVLIAISDVFVACWPLMLGGLVVAAIGAYAWLQTPAGRYRWDKWKLSLPVVGSIVHRATLSRFARAFAMAASAGVPLLQTLAVVSRAVGNEFVGDRVLQMRNGVERGDTLTRTAAATNLFTPLTLQMLGVGEETGQVDAMLEEVAGFYEREVDYEIKNLSAAIEPILIVAVGLMVLVVALGVFLPMWDLAAGVGLRK